MSIPAPPLSLRGVRSALRWPKGQDLLFAVKGVVAVTLALFIGFSQNLDNPYWSALTVYVLMSQPQTGAIRSKSLFRFGGTLVGGSAAIGLTALFGDNVGALLVALLSFIVAALYLKVLDRTPASYFWFATALTASVVGIVHVQAPDTIFPFAVARMTEISIGILCVGVADSLLGPQPQTQAFLDALRSWRDQAADWAAAALAPDASDAPVARLERRRALRRIAAGTAVLDAQGVQLPFDVVDQPLRGRDLRFLRLTVARLTAELTSANVWAEAARRLGPEADGVAALLARTRDWLKAKPALVGEAVAGHAADGETLGAALAAAADRLILSGARDDALRGTTLLRLEALVRSWTMQHQILHAMASGARLPPQLRHAARQARPARSIDYLASALDVLPLAVCFAGITIVWYLSAWTAALSSMLFVFVIGAFVLGAPGAVGAAVGELVWISLAFILTFAYQFAVLPQVTAFPVLMAVLAVALIPIGVFMSMSAAGVLILANVFAFLGLQGAYAGDFEVSVQTLFGSLTGCVLAIAALYGCRYDEARMRARRLARALALDVADAAAARRPPDLDRYVSLAVDRLSLFYAAQARVPAGDPLQGLNMIGRFRIGAALLALRRIERGLARAEAQAARGLRLSAATTYRRRDPAEGRSALLAQAEEVHDVVAASAPTADRREALAALASLRTALRPDEAFEALLRQTSP